MKESLLKAVTFSGINAGIAIFCILINNLWGCGDRSVRKTEQVMSFNELLVDTILSKMQFKMLEKDGISFYYTEDAFFNNNINRLADDALKARDACLRLLGVEESSYGLKVIYFNDREKLRPYLNMAPKGIALPEAYTLMIATNDTLRAYHTHEMMHIISISRFGGYAAGPSDWIQEGISVYADNPCQDYSIQAIGAYLYHTQKMPSLDSLINHFRSLPDMTAYMSTGSFTWFIIDKYGIEIFEKLWKQGAGKLPDVTGKTVTELETEYHNYLKQKYPEQPEIDWEILNNKGCG
jgi:hypothetical protein